MARKPFDPNRIKQPSLVPRELSDAASAQSKSTMKHPITVTQITTMVKQAIESALPATLHVVGEISNYKHHSSGHLYFTLKDDHCEISCVMWRSGVQKLKFSPDDGMEVVATGQVEVFERAGRYQLYVRKLEPRGLGALDLAFKQLCEKLHKEGLFEESRKKQLPLYPQRIVMITSPTGAAIADMLRTIERRYPCVDILVYPVAVQGDEAANQIAAAIRKVNAQQKQLGDVDTIIVGRGGGSLEDLWAFNEEVVARAIFASHIPIISAVGHEVDVTISDLVADVRAATPTAAAELAVPVLEEVLEELSTHEFRLRQSTTSLLNLASTKLTGLLNRRAFLEPFTIVQSREQITDELYNRITRKLSDRVVTLRRQLDRLEPYLQRIAPHHYLLYNSVQLRDAEYQLHWSIARRVASMLKELNTVQSHLDRSAPAQRIAPYEERLNRLTHTIQTSIKHRLRFGTEQIKALQTRMQAGSHENVLARGFSVTRTKKGRKVVRSMKNIRDGERMITQVADGEFESQVINVSQLELFSE